MKLDKSYDRSCYQLKESFSGLGEGYYFDALVAIVEVKYFSGDDDCSPTAHYNFKFWCDGVTYQIRDGAEFSAALQHVLDNEDDSLAIARWTDENSPGLVDLNYDTNSHRALLLCEAMKTKFQALLDLGAFSLEVTY